MNCKNCGVVIEPDDLLKMDQAIQLKSGKDFGERMILKL